MTDRIDEDDIKYLPDIPLTKRGQQNRRRLAKKLGVPLDKIPDRRGRNNRIRHGAEHHNWSGGFTIGENGYIEINLGVEHPMSDRRGYVYLHLLVWVTSGNRPPGPDELIHHKDENKENNMLKNLELMTRSAHSKFHATKIPRDPNTGQFDLVEDES